MRKTFFLVKCCVRKKLLMSLRQSITMEKTEIISFAKKFKKSELFLG